MGRMARPSGAEQMAALQHPHGVRVPHQAGLIHRDVKPQNILLDAKRLARLTDFDLVTGVHTTGGTGNGGLGSFVYAAPEQLDNASSVDQRADIYSLGMVALSVLNRKALPISIIRDSSRVIDAMERSGCGCSSISTSND